MITDCFDDKTEPVISLRDFYGEQKHLVETCLILFSQKIYQHLLEAFPCEKIGLIGACNGNIPIYRMNYKGKDIAGTYTLDTDSGMVPHRSAMRRAGSSVRRSS